MIFYTLEKIIDCTTKRFITSFILIYLVLFPIIGMFVLYAANILFDDTIHYSYQYGFLLMLTFDILLNTIERITHYFKLFLKINHDEHVSN